MKLREEDLVDLGQATIETKGPPGEPVPDSLGAFPITGLSDD